MKAVLQGHSHDIQEFQYNGIDYITTVAASAAWWGGTWTGFKQGYTQIHCDGDNLSWEHLTYEWVHQLEPEDTVERERIAEQEAELAAQKERAAEDRERGKTMKPLPTPELTVPLGA